MIKDSDNNKFSDEEWKSVVGYEGLYEVSNYGRVRSLRKNTRIKNKREKIMCLKDDKHGYYRVNLTKGKTHKATLVSRMVAEAFIPNPNNMPVVGHMDDIKKNNHVSNLYWTDQKENNHHNGKMERFIQKHNEKISIISNALSIPVIATDIITGEETHYKSMQEASRILKVNSGHISQCCNGKRNMAYKKKWRFADGKGKNI